MKNKNLISYLVVILFVIFIVFFVSHRSAKVDNNQDNLKDNILIENNSILSDQERQKIIDFISQTKDYKDHGRDIVLDGAYDASTYCQKCRYVVANYGDKLYQAQSDQVTFYDLGLLINGDGVVSILNIEKQSSARWDALKLEKEFNTQHLISRGQSLFGITLDNKGNIKYGEYVLPAKIQIQTNIDKTVTDFDDLLIFNFEKYNKVYFIADRHEADDGVEYVFDKKDNSLIQTPYQKYFSPFQVLGYSKNGRYLAMKAQRDDYNPFTIFDIEQNKYIGSQWFEGGFDIYDFNFIDNENFTYKYKTPESYANQEQLMKGNVNTFGNQ